MRSLTRYRSLLLTLTVRELKARYRGSVLGFLWSLVNPLLLASVYTLVFGTVLRGGRFGEIEAYSLFLITGLFPWIWSSSALLEGVVSLTGNAGLIKKAVFPIELLPVVSVLANLVHFVLALPIVLIGLGIGRWLGQPVGGWTALLTPAVILLQFVMLTGMALGLAALNVHFKDVRDLLANLLTLLFFLAPILYPLDALGRWLRVVVSWNPFTPFTIGYQDLLFRGELPDVEVWIFMVAFALFFWLVGTWIFARLSETVAEAV